MNSSDVAADQGPGHGGWEVDILGLPFRQRTIELGMDPDGEGPISASLVRYDGAPDEPRALVLYVHGLSDYFFQDHVAEYLATVGAATYALDLRKCGRSRRPGLTPHFVSDLEMYDTELDAALAIATAERPGVPVVVAAHSTGCLVTSLWLSRRRDQGRLDPVAGLIFNSPWFDLDILPSARRVLDPLLAAISVRKPYYQLPLATSALYGKSTHVSGFGDFEYDVELKPFGGVGVRAGWLRAIRRAQKTLQEGLDLPLPLLLLRSSRSSIGRSRSGRRDVDADLILSVRSMEKWAPQVSRDVTEAPLDGARHDVFLSSATVREKALDEVGAWLTRLLHSETGAHDVRGSDPTDAPDTDSSDTDSSDTDASEDE